ncbi:hypothetical protein F260042K2_38170 [Flavonifractor plautii]
MPAGMHRGPGPPDALLLQFPQSGARGKRRASAKALLLYFPDGKSQGQNCMKYGGIIAKQRAHVLY